MARRPGGVRRRGGRRHLVAGGDVEEVRKGPWMPEEDEVLRQHVRTHGPREWSTIQSNGLLPRTGKSCRLRWVNKLRPNLKTGCKFSAEEERVVIELQAQFGNKWARISSYLPGRTDNDVKNFWSTRQKRLARLLPARSNNHSIRSKGKAPSSSHLVPQSPMFHQVPYLMGEASSFEGDSSGGQRCEGEAAPFVECKNVARAPSSFHAGSGSLGLVGPGPLPLQVVPPIDVEASSSEARLAPVVSTFDQPQSCPLLDFPVGLPQRYVDIVSGFDFAPQELIPMVQTPPPMIFSFFDMEYAHDDFIKAEPRRDVVYHFDDFPLDFFDDDDAHHDQLPPPPPPPSPPKGDES